MVISNISEYDATKSNEILNKQKLISAIINTVLVVNSTTVFKSPEDSKIKYSSMTGVCGDQIDSDTVKRTACCTPSDVKHLYDVLVHNGKFVLFSDKPQSSVKLPAVTSVKTQQKVNYNVDIEYRNEAFVPLTHCTSYFNGTLHVVGKSTIKNVYHASKITQQSSITSHH
jgi:hypothetical protein